MAKLTPEAKTAISKTNPICIATSGKNGIPNIIYMTYLKVIDDETVVIADNKFDKTGKNLDENPIAAFVALDSDTKKAYQVKGRVKCVTEGKLFDEVVEWVHVKHPQMTPKAAFYMQVEELYCGAERLA